MEIDEHIGCAMSGLVADARTLVEHGRVETQVFFPSFLLHAFVGSCKSQIFSITLYQWSLSSPVDPYILSVFMVLMVLFCCELRFLSTYHYLTCHTLQNHRFSYNEPMSVESTTQALCDLALRFGEGDEESMVCNQLSAS